MEGSKLQAGTGAIEAAQLTFLQIAQRVHAGRCHVEIEGEPARVAGCNHGVIVQMHGCNQGGGCVRAAVIGVSSIIMA